MWMDDCGELAIRMLAYHTYPYMYADRELRETIPGLFLIRQVDAPVYEWWLLDSQLDLTDYCE